MYICMYVYACTYVCMYICMYVRMYTCMYYNFVIVHKVKWLEKGHVQFQF